MGGNERHEAPGGVGLLIVDMINPMAFPGSEKLVAAAEPATETILALRTEADRLGVPVIYVNDNRGRWRSERAAIVRACLEGDAPGRDISRRLAPRDEDYFVVKPQMSGFYATTLPVLLPQLGVRRIVLTGVAADVCVLFTAADAHMRAYRSWIPANAVAGEDPTRTRCALEIMTNALEAETTPYEEDALARFVRAPDDRGPDAAR